MSQSRKDPFHLNSLRPHSPLCQQSAVSTPLWSLCYWLWLWHLCRIQYILDGPYIYSRIQRSWPFLRNEESITAFNEKFTRDVFFNFFCCSLYVLKNCQYYTYTIFSINSTWLFKNVKFYADSKPLPIFQNTHVNSVIFHTDITSLFCWFFPFAKKD